jgi:hypothetical protein
MRSTPRLARVWAEDSGVGGQDHIDDWILHVPVAASLAVDPDCLLPTGAAPVGSRFDFRTPPPAGIYPKGFRP